LGNNGNIAEDPIFCDLPGGDLTLEAHSLCAQENNPGCGQIGALGIGCTIPRTVMVCPSDPVFNDIQDALDVVKAGDVIELCDDTYTGDRNRDLDIQGLAITIRSASGDATACIIDVQGGELSPHRAFLFHSGEGADTIIQDITITGGWMNDGGAVFCQSGSSPTFDGCVFSNNKSKHDGGAVWSQDPSSPMFTNCEFRNNLAGDDGGALTFRDGSNGTLIGCTLLNNDANDSGGGLYCSGASPTVQSCTFSGNAAPGGGAGLSTRYGSDVTIENTIIAFSTFGEAVHCNGGTATLTCCNLYGNMGGNWTGCIEGQYGGGNIEEDPQFCDRLGGDLTLRSTSPCAATNNPGCGQIGAWPVGCGCQSSFTTIQVVGDFNGWDENEPGMTQVGSCVWEYTMTVAAGCHYMKFRTDNAWATPPDYGTCTGEDPTCQVLLTGSTCLVSAAGTALGQIDFPGTGDYLFRLDESGPTYEIIYLGSPPDIDVDPPSLSFQVPEGGTDCADLTISNTGGFDLTYTATETETWLSAHPTGGAVSGGGSQVVQVCVDAAGLTPGSYATNLVIDSNDPDEPQVTVPVTLTVDPATRLGNLYLSFAPDQQDAVLAGVEPLVPFNWYVVAEIDFGDLGRPEDNTTNGLLGWEANLNVPPEITVTSRTMAPPGALDIGTGDDNWIVAWSACVLANQTPYALVTYEAMLASAAVNVEVTLDAASPSSFTPPEPGWIACDYQARVFDATWATNGVVVNPRIVVKPDGTGDYPTIQAAINECEDGYIIELTDGVFRDGGNRDLTYWGTAVTIRSQNGDPATCVIDCEGTVSDPHRAIASSCATRPSSKPSALAITR